MLELPLPGGFDDVVGRLILRLPLEHLARPVAAGDQPGGVAGAARADVVFDLEAGHLFRGVDDLLD